MGLTINGRTYKVDVADGASYITAEMCKNLLRQVGSWNDEIKRAFDILEGNEVDGKVYTVKDTLEVTQAYHQIITTVIGTQKYTAYGFRFEDDCAIPYYHKMALFPLFKNICTGLIIIFFNCLTHNVGCFRSGCRFFFPCTCFYIVGACIHSHQ